MPAIELVVPIDYRANKELDRRFGEEETVS